LIVSKTPYRISFFGGGTDLPQWYEEYGGSVISTSIDKYCYITCRGLLPFYPYKHRLVYSKAQTVNKLDEIEHPVIRETLKFLNVSTGLEIHHDGDLPARSGLGSSSSFTVGMLHVIRKFMNENCSSEELAKDAIYIEQTLLNEAVGSQDQIAASYGGFNKIEFHKNGHFHVEKLKVHSNRKLDLNDHMLLLFTGIQRFAQDIEITKINRIKEIHSGLTQISQAAKEAESLLLSNKFSSIEFGLLMHEGWKIKKELSPLVSNKAINAIYDSALGAGAVGGKLLGAGGGGFMLLMADPKYHAKIKKVLSPLVFVDFNFDTDGSTVTNLSG